MLSAWQSSSFPYRKPPCAWLGAAVLQDPQKYQGKSVPVVGEHISYPTIAEIISEVTGKTVKCAAPFSLRLRPQVHQHV